MSIRTRFAPSPTGYLHVGGARTALFNWLFARKHGGSFVLRVEDTDQARNTEEARQAIFEGMAWLGLDWDEGEGQGGDYGPYNQSERTAIYEKHFETLKAAGRVYEDGGAWRFRFERKPVVMNDLVCGEVTVDYSRQYDESLSEEDNRSAGYLPDLVIRRADGSFVFHFVNVVDDLEMKISHVIRGEDHLMNTPKHIQLFEALGAEPPQFAHIPLILNADGSKMSKRDEGAAVAEYAAKGFLPAATVNFLALLGWSPKNDSEVFSIAGLIERFSLEAVNRAPAKYDAKKCQWLNQQHLLALSPEAFVTAAAPYCEPLPDNFSAVAASVQEKVSLLTEVPEAIAFYNDPDYPIDSGQLAKVAKNEQAPGLLTALADAFESLPNWAQAKDAVGETAKANDAKPGQLMFPLRIALTGKGGGPDLAVILEILGQEECVRRIRRTVALFN
ncbi:glutamate--tRNA ligase [Roseibacillus ishigakijimensis]|uniref:Glutamate--tRNA ligase n=1 Tax=Roseibacillus ishigakijimensis TaxID=454146 RepID=A0A934VH22_9BACT|nr:glutamate--tRNA ligase family protein [Roseibacillus ishigakijimensis]MBK1833478.1 glutamate--tRNA ligase [Roseibacillus ishigakijimensis]